MDLVRGEMTAGELEASRSVEPLAHLDYDRELAVKTKAFGAFWKGHKLGGSPEPILRSPKPRHYRTTTRRRGRWTSGRFSLGYADDRDKTPLPPSVLEPESHTAIYRYLLEELSRPPNRPVASHLNHVIVRGSYEAFSVILNLDALNAPIVRRLKVLSERLQARPEAVLSAFAFCDPSGSDYYFERDPPPVPVQLKKLFGPARIPLRLGSRRYALPPTSFSQVNESMIGPMLETVQNLLALRKADRLLDLYCGYGLFAHHLSEGCGDVLGVDVNRDSIASAEGSRRNADSAGRVRFACRNIDAKALDRILPSDSPNGEGLEIHLLDPPRQGVSPGVIPYLAAREPARVLHLFCGIETLPRELGEWKRSGYEVARCVPLDMFAGTPNLETLVLLTPKGASG